MTRRISWQILVAAAVWIGGCGGGDQPQTGPTRALVQVEKLETRSLNLGEDVTMELVRVPAGRVRIGSPDSEVGRGDWEGPQRVVRFEKGFWIGKTEVTQAQYKQVIGSNPSRAQEPSHPVEWDADAALVADAGRFMAALSQKAGVAARLPTEAEWEYACRAPSKAEREADPTPVLPAYGFGSNPVGLSGFGWADLSGGRTHPVGELAANRFGLLDMHGNVAELCSDTFANYPGGSSANARLGQGYPVTRGGSWVSQRVACRSAARSFFLPTLVAPGTVGLRVVVPIE